MKRLTNLILCAVLALSLAACGGSSAATRSGEPAGSAAAGVADYSAENPYVLKMGMANSGTDPLAIYAAKACEEIMERSEGRIVMEFYPNNELGYLADLVEQSQRGAPLITMCSSDFWTDYAPDLGVLNAPYMFDDWQREIPLIAESEWLQEQAALLRDNGLELLLAGYCVGPRHMVSDHDLSDPDSLRGLKFRTSGGAVFVAMAETLGCAPVTTSWSELYQALQQGVVDVGEGDYGLLESISIWEVAKYVNLTGHITCDNLFCMPTSVFDQLTAEDQAILKETLAENSALLAAHMAQLEEQYIRQFEENGMVFVQVDREAYRQAASGTVDALGVMSEGIYDKVRGILESAS